jgi:siroheme synthase
LPTQRVVHGRLGAIADIEPQLAAPAIVVLGPVRDDLGWYVDRLRENGLG